VGRWKYWQEDGSVSIKRLRYNPRLIAPKDVARPIWREGW
jgi:hypothetical protein